MKPDPAVINENVTITADVYNGKDAIIAGNYSVKITVNNIPIPDLTGDLCNQTVFPCPIAVGDLSTTQTMFLPVEVLAGNYSMHANATVNYKSTPTVKSDFIDVTCTFQVVRK